MSSATRGTYVYPIDKHGEITAHVNDFIISQESYACSIGLELGVDGMRPYFLHLDNAELASRHPTAIRKPPPIEPIRPPVDDPNFTNAYKLFEADEKRFNLYHSCVLLLIAAFFDMMTEDDKPLIRTIDPYNGMSSVTLNVMYKFVMARYGEFSDSAQKTLRLAIEGNLSLSDSLEANLNRMQVANSVLLSHGIGLGYSENLLFTKAFDKLKLNPRTTDIAEDFKKRDGYTPSGATFTDFKKYVISQYDVRTPPPSTAAYVFGNEPKEDLIESFAAATISTRDNDAPTKQQFDALVAQVNSLRPNQTKNSSNLGPAPGYCILHGFCSHGPGLISNYTQKPTFCKNMSDADGNPKPNTAFTKEQILCKSPKGGPVGGMTRSQAVQRGFTKP